MIFKTLNDLNCTISKNMHQIPNDVDLIVGIPRSGMLVANLLSLYLNLPLADINSFINGSVFQSGTTKIKSNWINNVNEARKILIVDDSCLTGKSILKVKKQLSNYSRCDKLIYCCVYVTKESKKFVDIWFEECATPRLFEWNYAHHSLSNKVCYDIDGELCEDPTNDENDDGEKYQYFIINTKARFQPTFTIGCLITSRLEKYRDLTEKWLSNNNIKYNKLIMMNYETKEERILHADHGVYKGNIYKDMKEMILFVESNPLQAEQIAKISGKTVFCTGNRISYKENYYHHLVSNNEKIYVKIKQNIPSKLKKIY